MDYEFNIKMQRDDNAPVINKNMTMKNRKTLNVVGMEIPDQNAQFILQEASINSSVVSMSPRWGQKAQRVILRNKTTQNAK